MTALHIWNASSRMAARYGSRGRNINLLGFDESDHKICIYLCTQPETVTEKKSKKKKYSFAAEENTTIAVDS